MQAVLAPSQITSAARTQQLALSSAGATAVGSAPHLSTGQSFCHTRGSENTSHNLCWNLEAHVQPAHRITGAGKSRAASECMAEAASCCSREPTGLNHVSETGLEPFNQSLQPARHTAGAGEGTRRAADAGGGDHPAAVRGAAAQRAADGGGLGAVGRDGPAGGAALGCSDSTNAHCTSEGGPHGSCMASACWPSA